MTKNNPLFNTIGVLSNSFAGWIIVSILSYIFGFKEIGLYSYFLAIITPIHVLLSLQLRNYFNSTHKEIISEEDIITLRLFSSLLFIVLCLIFGLIFIETKYLIAFYLISLTKLFDYASEVSYSIKQSKSNLRYIGISLFFKSLLVSSLFITLSYLYKNFTVSLLALPVVSFIFSLIDSYNIKEHFTSLRLTNLKLVLTDTIPLGFSALVVALNINTPRYLIKFLKDEHTLGVFTSIIFFYTLIMIVANSLIQSVLGKLANASKEQNKYKNEIFKYLKLLVIFTLLFILGNSFFGKFFYALVYSKKASSYSHFLIHLNYLVPLGLLSTKANYMTMAQNDYKKNLFSNLISCLLHIILSYYLISLFDIAGAFYAFGISLFIASAINLSFILKKAGLNKWKTKTM